jgi:hypothetical protein
MTITTDRPAGLDPDPDALIDAECTRCGPLVMEYVNLLGHDRRGHLAHSLLAQAGYVRTSEVALASDAELRTVNGMGPVVLAYIRTRIPHGATPLDRYTPTVLMHRLPPGLRLQPWMYTEPDRASALWCLSAFPADDERVWPHVHDRAISFPGMWAQAWRDGERVLVRAARSLYTSHVGVSLSDAARLLTADQWHVLLEALRIRRDGSRSNP